MGRPDAIQFNDFKPPDSRKMTFEHTFYLELENMNFVHLNKKIKPPNVTLPDADVPTTYFQSPPFFNFPWWLRGWYLSPNEFAWLRKNSNYAKINNTTWQANVVGVRLPLPLTMTSLRLLIHKSINNLTCSEAWKSLCRSTPRKIMQMLLPS